MLRMLQLSLVLGSPHIFYSCGEDGVVYQIDLRQEKPNKYVLYIEHLCLLKCIFLWKNYGFFVTWCLVVECIQAVCVLADGCKFNF